MVDEFLTFSQRIFSLKYNFIKRLMFKLSVYTIHFREILFFLNLPVSFHNGFNEHEISKLVGVVYTIMLGKFSDIGVSLMDHAIEGMKS